MVKIKQVQSGKNKEPVAVLGARDPVMNKTGKFFSCFYKTKFYKAFYPDFI